MDTAVITIGNSDDKLTQAKWSSFVNAVSWIIFRYDLHPHFSGFSVGSAPWQNACWIVALPEEFDIAQFKFELRRIAQKYDQDSIALLLGDTEFVTS